MAHPQPKSIVLKNKYEPRVYRTFEDWQADQARDMRTPAQRGIDVGSSVMWRHRDNHIIVTERAIVISVSDDIVMLEVKDVTARRCSVHPREIVTTEDKFVSTWSHATATAIPATPATPQA